MNLRVSSRIQRDPSQFVGQFGIKGGHENEFYVQSWVHSHRIFHGRWKYAEFDVSGVINRARARAKVNLNNERLPRFY